ncbi:MAG TPA: alpha-L-arabinofuranosidase, partial [Roseiflexaceae bacterium]|nr:alpha-L-arabinofuranosidase [Roseiflexaceae bacterium]
SAARPSDFLSFAKAVDAHILWTVSMNGTSKEAAALVAFFNGRVDDATPIGVDVRGRDWKTIGYWAQLRSKNGHPEPYPVHLWEVGNEAYGAKQSTGGSKCAAWGWEEVWTCDATEYVNGKGSGAERHEGFLEFRTAMRAVDPTIQVGAIGVDDPASWSQWGEQVIKAAGADMDFYVVHLYPYWEQPPSAPDVLTQPAKIWKKMIDRVNAASQRFANGRKIPIAVTEYNLVSSQDKDNEQLMLRAVNALYMADSIGQMAQHGVAIANTWNLANGVAPNGTDYGMVDADTQVRHPQYYALWAWARFGTSMLPVDVEQADPQATSVYAGRDEQGTISLLLVNKSEQPVTFQVQVRGIRDLPNGTLDAITADSLEATDVLVNGVANPNDDFGNAPSQPVPVENGSIEITIAPFSLSLARFPAQTT